MRRLTYYQTYPWELVLDDNPQLPNFTPVGERYLLDGQPLVPTDEIIPSNAPLSCLEGKEGRVYRLRKEGGFQRIVRCGDDPWSYHWEVISRNGVRFIYGEKANAKVANPKGLTRLNLCGSAVRNIGRWLLEKVVDADDNSTEYRYIDDDQLHNDFLCGLSVSHGISSREIKEITYTKNEAEGLPHTYIVEFNYEPRAESTGSIEDHQVDARFGFRVVRSKRLSNIVVKCLEDGCTTEAALPTTNPEIIREYQFDYLGPNPSTLFKSLLSSVVHCGAGGCESSAGQETVFTYSSPNFANDSMIAFGSRETRDLPDTSAYPLSLTSSKNLNIHGGAGLSPLAVIDRFKAVGHLGVSTSLSPAISDSFVQLMDLNGDGLPDQLATGRNSDLNLTVSSPLAPTITAASSEVLFNTGRTRIKRFYCC